MLQSNEKCCQGRPDKQKSWEIDKKKYKWSSRTIGIKEKQLTKGKLQYIYDVLIQ